MSSSATVFKLGQQTGNIYLLTSGLVNSDKKIYKMAPNGWHLSISRILNGFPWLENTILHFLRLLINVNFARFWEHNFQLPRFFALLRTSLPTAKKVPFCTFHDIAWNRKKRYLFLRFKTSFGEARNGWRADNIDVKISFTRKMKIPDFFLTFFVNDKHRQKR